MIITLEIKNHIIDIDTEEYDFEEALDRLTDYNTRDWSIVDCDEWDLPKNVDFDALVDFTNLPPQEQETRYEIFSHITYNFEDAVYISYTEYDGKKDFTVVYWENELSKLPLVFKFALDYDYLFDESISNYQWTELEDGSIIVLDSQSS